MALRMSPRVCVFISFTALFHFCLAGFLTFFAALPITVIVTGLLSYYRIPQLPVERLHKFVDVFGLNLTSSSASTTSNKLTLASGDGQHKRIILHRGGCVDHPENTLEAIREAAKEGVAGVEIDLQFTADGVGILLHDDTLDRTTDGTGDVRKKMFSELVTMDAAAKHKNRENFSGQVKIPTLEECVTECLRLNLLVFIDCKAFADKTAVLIDKLFNQYPELYDTAAVCSFHPNVIYKVRRLNARVITGLTHRRKSLSCEQDCVTPLYKGAKHWLWTLADYLNIWLVYAWSWWLCGNSFLLLNKESVSRNEVNWWKDLGILMMPWTVNSVAEKRCFMDSFQLPIITDGLNTQ